MKKTIIIVLIFSLLLSGCSRGTDDNAAQSKDITTVTIAMIGDDLGETNETTQKISDKIKNQFGIEIQLITFSEETYADEIQNMIDTNTLPDVFYHDMNAEGIQYKQMMDIGLIRDIPKSMWTQKNSLSRVISWYEEIYSIDNKMYFIPRTYQTYNQTHGATNVILYRKDWAETTNTSLPTDAHFFDYAEMIRAFTADDPDGDDIKNTFGLTGYGGFDFVDILFLQKFGIREWEYEGGEWKPGMLSDKSKTAIAWASQLFKEGLIDPHFTTQTKQDALNAFCSGKAGSILISAYPKELQEIEDAWKIQNKELINNAVGIIPIFVAPDGYHYNEVESFDTVSLISSKVDDEKLDKILDLYSWLYTQEGRMYMQYGEENTDYMFVGNTITPVGHGEGEVKFFGEKNTIYKPLEHLASWNLDLVMPTEPVSEFQKICIESLWGSVWPYSYEKELFTKGMTSPELCLLNIEEVAIDEFYKLIMTSRDFDNDWDEFVKYCYDNFNVTRASKEVLQRAMALGIK